MTAPQATISPAKTIRLIHGAMVTGVLLFAVVGYFVLRKQFVARAFPPVVPQVLLAVSVSGCAMALLLRRLVPHRSTSQSPDAFWTRAIAPALVTWAPLEAAALMSIIAYAMTGSVVPVAVATVAVLIFAALNPGTLEKA